MFAQRKDDIEKLNALTGLNVTIDYGEILTETKRHYEEVMSQYPQEESPNEEGEEGGEENANNAQSE